MSLDDMSWSVCLPRVTQNCDFQVPEMPNQLDTCPYMIAPCVLSDVGCHLSLLTWFATFTYWICRPRSLCNFTYHDFGILDVNVLHIQVLVCKTPKWSQISFLAFLTSQLWDSCDEESRHLTPPSPGIQNSETESDQQSRSNFDLMAKVISRFRISRVREVREPRSFEFPVSERMISHHVSFLDRWFNFVLDPMVEIISWFSISQFRISRLWDSCSKSSWHPQLPVSKIPVSKTVSFFQDFDISHFAIPWLLWWSVLTLQLPVSETPKWSQINVFRRFAFHRFDILVVSCFLDSSNARFDLSM